MTRVRTQIRRKRYADRLRDNVQLTLEMAITDNLTGLHNRHYLERHLGTLVEQATKRGRPLSLLLIDIDYFKVINDTHGHLSGDKVLVGFADRIRSAVRGVDLASRFGGEEFVVAMPDASAEVANHVGERLRGLISAKPFEIGEEREPVSVTASIGVASIQGPEDNAAGPTQAYTKPSGAAAIECRRWPHSRQNCN